MDIITTRTGVVFRERFSEESSEKFSEESSEKILGGILRTVSEESSEQARSVEDTD